MSGKPIHDVLQEFYNTKIMNLMFSMYDIAIT